jgi:hypothetical protein
MNNLERYITMALFSGYVGKLLLLGAGLSDVGVVLVLAAISFLFATKAEQAQINQLKQLVEKSISENKNEVLRLQAMVDEHRTSLTSIKMSQGIKGVR